MTLDNALLLERWSLNTPVTSITHLHGTPFLLSGSATFLQLDSFNSFESTSTRSIQHRWKVFERERIHRIVTDPLEVGKRRRVIVLGGKEAALIELVLKEEDSSQAQLKTLARFALDDFAGDASFFENDCILISTLHNSIHVFSLPSTFASDSTASSPLLRSISNIHAPARPLLWTSRFSQSRSSKEEGIRIAGGSLLGEVLIWDIDQSEVASIMRDVEDGPEDDHREVKVETSGRLRRLNGHRGAIFTTVFSPNNPNLLATGSDDRTLRIWDLSSFSSNLSPTTSTAAQDQCKAVEGSARTLWGHEGRVWRIEWVDEKRLVSVAEDATCRLWELNSSTTRTDSPLLPTSRSANESTYTLLQTWRDGHDGRTIWSVGVADVESGRGGEGGKVVFTGGADGTIRSWPIPSKSLGATNRSPARSNKLLKGSQIKSFVVAVDPSTDRPLALSLRTDGSFCLHDPSTPAQSVAPFHRSSSFANSSASLHLFLTPASESTNGCATATVHAFSNKGSHLSAQLSIFPTNDPPASSPSIKIVSIAERDIGIKTVLSTFDSTRRRVAIWERATWTIYITSLASSTSTDSPPLLLSTIAIEPSLDGSTAPTSFLFLHNRTRLLVGNAKGQLSLYSLSTREANLTLLASVDAHSDGVQDLRILNCCDESKEEQTERFGIESIGRDGMRKVIEITDEPRWEMNVVDERWIAKGPVEMILTHENGETRYFALIDTRAGVFDSLNRMLYSFESPGKQIPSQLVQTRKNGLHYYRLVQGQLHHQCQPSSFLSPIVSPGLHGREIRAVKMQSFEIGGERIVLVATAAENGVLAVSELMNDNSLRPLYLNRFLPSSLKSLTFSPPTSSSNSSTTTLYACGTRELVTGFDITVVANRNSSTSTADSRIELRVLSKGMILAEAEGGEVRTMDIALVETRNEEDRLILAGYSNGKLRLWRHSGSTFEVVAETEGLGKCILSVEVAKVKVDGKEKVLAISGQSDGRLSIRDLTSFVNGPARPSALPSALYISSPHQSGINGLTVSVEGSSILVATAGDDNAVSLERIEFSGKDEFFATSIASAVLPNAHASTIQGLNFLSPNLLASSSVEQRLNFYSVESSASQCDLSLALVESTCLDVADCSAQDAIQIDEEGEKWKVVVAGIGIEVVEVLRRTV